jgi:hypothetical protein
MSHKCKISNAEKRQSSTAKGGLTGNHPGAIHPNPICGIAYDITSQDKLRSACAIGPHTPSSAPST